MLEIAENLSHLSNAQYIFLISMILLTTALEIARRILVNRNLVMAEQPTQLQYALPDQESGQRQSSIQSSSDTVEEKEESDESPTTSLGEELYNKKFGLILLFVCWVWRYPIGIHFPELWIKSDWQFHAAMGVLVISIWLYGMLRHNKRSYVDHAVNFLLGLWGILLFLVEGELTL